MSIAAALLMPTSPPATGEARLPLSVGDDAFASLLDAEIKPAEMPAASTALQTFSTASPSLQLQTLSAAGADAGAIAGVDLMSAAGIAATRAGVDAPAPPSAPSPSASTQVEGVATALIGSDPSAQTSAAITPQQSSAALAAAATILTPSNTASAATDADGEVSEPGAETIGEGAATSSVTVPTTPTGTVSVMPTVVSLGAPVSTDAGAALTQPTFGTSEITLATEAVTPDAAEPASANPGGRASAAQTPNQPAAAAAAQAGATTQTADAAAAKPDFAAMLASQSVQATDATAQTSSQTSETARSAPTPAALQAAPAATIQVYNRIIERADGRAQRFEIRLDPAELGRVDVRIEIGADRKVHAVLAAHDSAALSDLMRGQRALERALADAGIDLADNGVRFELARDNGSSSANQHRDGDGRPSQANVWRRFDTTVPATEDTAAAAQPSWRPQRLDLVA